MQKLPESLSTADADSLADGANAGKFTDFVLRC